MNHAAPGGCHNQMMVVYSPGGGNGKSEIAANLAYCLANYGTRTWLLDANIFAPTQDIIFNLDPTGPTFSEYLYDRRDSRYPHLQDVQKPSPVIPRLHYT